MANRRMISKSISTSRKLSRVSYLAALLFTWIIPHADDGGNMDEDWQIVAATVVPLVDFGHGSLLAMGQFAETCVTWGMLKSGAFT
jgi:hypothetical protein